MNPFVLIIFIFSLNGSGGSATQSMISVPFKTAEACMTAAKDVKQTMGLKDSIVTARCYSTK